jgi:hypothetical protein
MSRHHVQLPPLAYLPPPKPKKLERRKSLSAYRIRTGSSVTDTSDAAEIGESFGLGQPAPANDPHPGEFSGIDDSEPKPEQERGLLSQGTLKEMLLVQEKLK